MGRRGTAVAGTVLAVAGLATATAEARLAKAERQALVALYESTGGDGWRNSAGWLGDAGTECQWFGVSCDANERHVTSIALTDNGLAGPLPPAIGDLDKLRALFLYRNELSGSLPPEIGRLEDLQQLGLGDNQLSGPIPPEIGQLSELRQLSLNNNRFTDTPPTSIGQLSKLETVDLASNLFAPAPLPIWLRGMATLRHLRLANSNVTGPLPQWISELSGLVELSLEHNRISGPLPSDLGQLASLEDLYLGGNAITGPIPPSLGGLSNLRRLSLRSNRLTGDVPSSLANLLSLTDGAGLDLRWNCLTASDPAVRTFLTAKHVESDWEGTQTVAPASIGATASSNGVLAVSWLPIPYTDDPGGYRVLASTTPGGPYDLAGETASKSADSLVLEDLPPAEVYYVVMETATGAHQFNSNELSSPPSPELRVEAEPAGPAGVASSDPASLPPPPSVDDSDLGTAPSP